MSTARAANPEERLRLALAACQWSAQAAGVDILFVKGVAAFEQMPSRPSVGTDVDLIVRPAHVGTYVHELEKAGWVVMRAADSLDLSNHAVVLEHPEYACTVDVHRHFPGFGAAPEVVFQDLWTSRVPLVVAGILCGAPSPVHHGVVLIVNAARSSGSDEACKVWGAWSEAERGHAREIIRRLEAEPVAGTQLPGEFDASRSYYWQVVADHPTGTAMWLARLAETTGVISRLRMVVHALVPPAAWGLGETRLDRARRAPSHWVKGLRQLPDAVQRLWSMRRG